MNHETNIFDARLQHPFCLLVCGPSMSGKSTFVTNLIKHSDRLINRPPTNIVWFYGIHTPAIDYLQLEAPAGNVKTVQGVPSSFDDYIDPNSDNMFVFDDLMQETVNNKNITDLFTRQSHHMNTSVVLIMQDIFYDGTQRKTFLRNAHYLVLFSSPLDMSGIYAVGNKIMPKRVPTFLKIFEVASERAHGYLFIDGRQTTPSEARLKTDIFKPYQRVFIPKA